MVPIVSVKVLRQVGIGNAECQPWSFHTYVYSAASDRLVASRNPDMFRLDKNLQVFRISPFVSLGVVYLRLPDFPSTLKRETIEN